MTKNQNPALPDRVSHGYLKSIRCQSNNLIHCTIASIIDGCNQLDIQCGTDYDNLHQMEDAAKELLVWIEKCKDEYCKSTHITINEQDIDIQTNNNSDQST